MLLVIKTAFLYSASQFGSTPVVAYLVASGQSVNSLDSSNMTPLMWSAFKVQNVNPLGVLLKFGADINRTDSNYYNTALHWASVAGNLSAIRELLKCGASLESLNKQNETPLDIARHEGHTMAVRILETAARRRGLMSTNWKYRLREDENLNRQIITFLPLSLISILLGLIYLRLNVQLKLVFFVTFLVLCVFFRR